MRTRFPVRLLLAGLLLGSGWACTDTLIDVVDVAHVDIEPATVSLGPGETRQLQARLTDADGNTLTGRPVQWSSGAAGVAAVDENGLILGVGAGTAIITAVSAGVQGTAQISVSAAPVIVAEPDSVHFEAVPGESGLDASIGITNGGGGTLSGLSVSIEYGAGATGWLDAVLSATAAPAALDLGANASGLTPGIWRADVRVASVSPGAAPILVPVVITVLQPNPVPSLVSVTPEHAARGQTVAVIMTGAGFVQGLTTVAFGPGISVNDVKVEGPTTLTAGVTIGPSAAVGTRDVSVTNPAPGGGTATLTDAFFVEGLNPAPTITSIEPASAQRQSTVDIRVNGTGFLDEITTADFGPGITVNSIDIISPAALTATVTIGSSATIGARDVIVANPEPGGGADTLSAALTVTAANPAPTLTSVTPASAQRLATVRVELAGSNFSTALTSIDFGADITVSEMTVTNAATITADITIGATAALGSRAVSVTNAGPGGGTATLADAFTVRGAHPTPELQSIEPVSGPLGQTLDVAITGSGFIDGITTVDFGAGIEVNDVTVASATSLTADVTIAADATPGTRSVAATNPAPGGGTSTLSDAFTVIGAISANLSSVTAAPASGVPANGSATSTVTVKLRDAAGSAVAGVAPDEFVLNATGSAATGAISESATPGTYSFTVTNTVAETVTILVQANGVSLSSTPTVQFVAGPAAQLSIITQPSSAAASGAAFEQQPVVRLLDDSGNPALQADVVVTAAIATGGGTLGGTQAAATNELGIATFTDLSISGTVGERRLEFSAQGVAPDTSGTISVTAGAAEQIGLHAGDGQSATVGTAVAIPPAVLVTDAAGNPVEGVDVTFAITAGGGSLAAPGLVTTAADGIATSPAWTLGPAPGDNTLTATAAGLTGSPVTFTATGTAPEESAVRIVTFGDSNTDYGYASTTSSSIEARSYVSNRITGRLAPADAHHPNQLAGLIEARWVALESSDITAVNHGIGGTTSGGGIGGGSDRHSTSAPNARTVVDGITRYEAEVLGKGYPWNGDEFDAVEFPDGGLDRVNSFAPSVNDFAYVSIGTNDQNSGVSAEQTIANLTWMVDAWLAEGLPAQQFIITTLAPRGTAGSAFPQINSEIRTLVAARGIHLVDLAAYTSDDNGATWKSADLHVGDELHYTVAVREWIADQVVAHMRSVTPDLMISGRE